MTACPPSISLTYAAYDAFNNAFRNVSERAKVEGKEIKLAPSGCDLMGRMVVCGIVYALMEVMAVLELIARLMIASLVVIPWSATLLLNVDIKDSFFSKYLVKPFITEGLIAGSSACLALIAAQYFNVTRLQALSSQQLYDTVYPCCNA